MDTPSISRIVLVAQDCPVEVATAPPARPSPTAAQLQHEMIAAAPFGLTEDDVVFESWWQRQDGAASASAQEKARAREQYFATPRRCLRASPLPQRYGWGLVFDAGGRVALCPVESAQYRELASGAGGVEVQKSFRRSRR